MNKFHGIFPALLTPFDKNGEINYSALKKLVRFNLDKGVNGFYVCGSTSEAFLMSMDERKKVLSEKALMELLPADYVLGGLMVVLAVHVFLGADVEPAEHAGQQGGYNRPRRSDRRGTGC